MDKIKVAVAVAMLVASPALAQSGQQAPATDGLSTPRVDHVVVRASALHWGMPAAEAARIMGTPSRVDSYADDTVNVRVLDFPDELIPTKVTLVNEAVTGVALEVARLDERALPSFSRAVWPSMHRASVSTILGPAKVELHHQLFKATLDQLIYERPDQPDVSVYLMDDQVIAKTVGRILPVDLMHVVLPTPDDETAGEKNDQVLRIGMTAAHVRALYGAPKVLVNSTFKGQPVEYAVFETRAAKSFGRFTFVGGVLTEFAISKGSLGDIPWGG